MNKERFPNTNMGWHQYYVKRYNKSQHSDAAYLATLHLFFHLAFGDTKIPA